MSRASSGRAKPPARNKTTRPSKRSPSHPSPTVQQLRRLAADIARGAQIPEQKVEPITHAEVEDAMAWYVSDERAGKNVTQLYPAVAAHLRTCRRCADSYSILKLAFEEPAESVKPDSATITARLPFLAPPAHKSWSIENASQLLGRDRHVKVLINPTWLKSRFMPSPALNLRGERESDESLVLSDGLMLGEQPADVDVWLRLPTLASDEVQVRVEIVSPAPLPEPLHVRLQWGDQEQVSVLDNGLATFDNLGVPDFSKHAADAPSHDFSLTVEPPGPLSALHRAD